MHIIDARLARSRSNKSMTFFRLILRIESIVYNPGEKNKSVMVKCEYFIEAKKRQCAANAKKNEIYCVKHFGINSVESENLDVNIESKPITSDVMTPKPESEYTKQEIPENESKIIQKSVNDILGEYTSIKRSTYLQDTKNNEYVHTLNNLCLLIRVCIEKKHTFFWCYDENDAKRFVEDMHYHRYECHEVLWHANCKFFCDIDLIMSVDMRSELLKQMPEDELFGSIVDAYEQAINLSLKSQGIDEDIDFNIIKRCRSTEAGYKYSIHLISQFWMSIAKAKELAKAAMDQIDNIDTNLDRDLLRRSFDLQPYHKHGSLSMKGGWKGNHWNRMHCSNYLTDPCISLYHEYCEVLPAHAFPTSERVPGTIDDDFIKEALEHVEDIPDWSDAFDLDASSLKGATMIVKRVRASVCSICERVHDNDNTLLLAFGDGKAFWKCMHSINAKAKLFYKRAIAVKNESDPIDWPKIASFIDDSCAVPAIFDKRNLSCFEDCTDLSKQDVADMPELIKYILGNVSYITNGGNGFFQTKRLDDYNNLTYSQVSTNSFKNLLVYLNIMGIDGKIRKQSLFDVLIKYIPDLSYGRVDFIPYGLASEYDWSNRKIFNCFTGFMHKFEPSFQIDHNLIARYLGHLKDVWAAGDENVYQGILKQFAHYVQKPQVKTQLCLVVLGREGTGKNRPINLLSEYVLGKQYCLESSKMEEILGKFNAALENRLLCVLNEATDCSSKESLSNQDKLKDIITNEQINIQKKHIDPYTIADRCNYIAFSNNRYVIKSSSEMRRFAMLESSDCRMNDYKHFKDLTEDFSLRGAGPHLYHYLMSIDITDYYPQRDFPQTKLKQEIRGTAIPKHAQWLIAYCDDELQLEATIDDGKFTPTAELFGKYQYWLRSNGYPPAAKSDPLGSFLTAIGFVGQRPMKNGIRVKGYAISKSELKIKLEEYFKRSDLFADENDPELPADCA